MSKTDCRSADGITVGLIDSIMSICRVLAPRLHGFDNRIDGPITEALEDMGCDGDLNSILSLCPVSRLPEEEAKLYERVRLGRKTNRTNSENERLRELDEFAERLPTMARNDRDGERESFTHLMLDLARELGSEAKRCP